MTEMQCSSSPNDVNAGKIPSCIDVSFIVPAYNAAGTLERAVRSAIGQNGLTLEVIVVDDGSVDGTLAVANAIAEHWANVRVIHTSNGGVSRARNVGLNAALGTWVAFLDSDDELVGNAYGELLGGNAIDGFDIVFGLKEYVLPGELEGRIYKELAILGEPLAEIGTIEVFRNLLSIEDDSLSGSCTRAIYRREWLLGGEISFPVGITMAEDYCFLLSCLESHPRIAKIGLLLYRVNQSGASVTSGVIPAMDKSMDYTDRSLELAVGEYPGLRDMLTPNLANNAWLRLDNQAKASFADALRVSRELYSTEYIRNAIHDARADDKKNKVRQAILKTGLLHPLVPAAVLRLKRWLGGFRWRINYRVR